MIAIAREQLPQGFFAVRDCLTFGMLHKNQFELRSLIAFALVRGVKVEASDHPKSLASGWAASDSGMRMRNEHIAAHVKKVTGTASAREGNAAGSLLFFGSAHFEGVGSLLTYYPGLVWICTDRDPVTRALDVVRDVVA